MGSFIESLKREGDLVLHHSYQSGHYDDLSGNSNDGTSSQCYLNRSGMSPRTSSGRVVVSDSLELRPSEITIVVLGDIKNISADQVILSKGSALVTNWEISAGPIADSLKISTEISIRTVFSPIPFSELECFAMSANGIDSNQWFFNGANPATTLLSAPDTTAGPDLNIGNSYQSEAITTSSIKEVLVINRVLTATEHSLIYSELSKRRPVLKTKSSSSKSELLNSSESGFYSGWLMEAINGSVIESFAETPSGNNGDINNCVGVDTFLGNAQWFSFDKSSYIDTSVSTSEIDVNTESHSFGCWIRARKETQTQMVFGKGSVGTSTGWRQGGIGITAGGQIDFSFYDDNLSGTTHLTSISINEESTHYVEYTMDMSSLNAYLYVDGYQVGPVSLANMDSSSSHDTQNWLIGNFTTVDGQGSPFNGKVMSSTFYNKARSASEVLKTYEKAKDIVQFKADYGAVVMPSLSSVIEAKKISNTPFILVDGSIKISTDAIDSSKVKTLHFASAATSAALHTHSFNDTSIGDAAYGTWEFYLKLDPAGTGNRGVFFITQSLSSPYAYDGYYCFCINSNNAVFIKTKEIGQSEVVQFTSTDDYLSDSVWYKIRIERKTNGQCSLYVDDTLVPHASNPFSETSVTYSEKMDFIFNTNDKISLCDSKGNYSVVKYFGA